MDLIKTLNDSAERLELLTGGEVDSVTDASGRSFLLHTAQQKLRASEAAKQSAILDALPAHVALLDTDGVIISVNQAWRQFAAANGLQGPRFAIGVNYLDVCDKATGAARAEAQAVADAIRRLQAGSPQTFSMHYACHSPEEERWFQMTVSRLLHDRTSAIVVMHMDVTEGVQAKNALATLSTQSARLEWMLSTMLTNITDFAYIFDREGRFLYANQPLLNLLGINLQAAIGKNFLDLGYPAELAARLQGEIQEVLATGARISGVTPFVSPAGASADYEYILSPVVAADRSIEFVVGCSHDVTELTRAAELHRAGEREQRQLVGELAAERSRLVTAQRVAKIGSWETDLATLEVIWSGEIHRIYETDEATYRPTHQGFLDLVHPDDRVKVKAAFAASLGQQGDSRIEHRLRLADGRSKVVEERWLVLHDAQGHPVRAIGTCQDITERNNATRRISYLTRIYAMLSGINTLIVRERDRDALFSKACRIAAESGGFRMAWIGMVDSDAMRVTPVASHGVDQNRLDFITNHQTFWEGTATENTLVSQAIRAGKTIVVNDLSERDTTILTKSLEGSDHGSAGIFPLCSAGEVVGVMAFYASDRDFFHVGEVKLLEELAGDIAFAMDHLDALERLNYLAYYDALTGLANRNLFLERVEQFMRGAVLSGKPLALFFVDLDRFRSINESFGRAAGDELLKQVADWLRERLGGASMLARLDADHFAVVMPVIEEGDDLTALIERMMDAFLKHPFQLGGAVVRVAARVGVAISPADGESAEILFKCAEAALKKAKAGGDRFLFFNHSMTSAVAGRLNLENQLRRAMDNEEFVLHYQPKWALLNDSLSGGEALIRWNDSKAGLVPPYQFIPILEETGMIHDVGRWALKKAIRDALSWRAAGLSAVRIAVNVSPRQLRSPSFVEEVRQVICLDERASSSLELEITESLIMEDVNLSINTLTAIRAMGVSIAIDDFGTGFSSLAYLAKLPVDTLKIDRSFVIDMTASPEGLSLVSTIINLAHSFRLKVVAEGVETEEQKRLLRLLGCDEMQGFLFSKAVPAEAFAARFLGGAPTT